VMHSAYSETLEINHEVSDVGKIGSSDCNNCKDLCGTSSKPEYKTLVTDQFHVEIDLTTLSKKGYYDIISPIDLDLKIEDGVPKVTEGLPIKKQYFQDWTTEYFTALVLRPDPIEGILRMHYEYGKQKKCWAGESHAAYFVYGRWYNQLSGTIKANVYDNTVIVGLSNVGLLHTWVKFYDVDYDVYSDDIGYIDKLNNVYSCVSNGGWTESQFPPKLCQAITDNLVMGNSWCKMNDDGKLNYIPDINNQDNSNYLSCYCRPEDKWTTKPSDELFFFEDTDYGNNLYQSFEELISNKMFETKEDVIEFFNSYKNNIYLCNGCPGGYSSKQIKYNTNDYVKVCVKPKS
ncbi:MAG: hypothetical protein ABIG89_00380, partial [Candidatus Woesearchaeota archaeon]